MHIQIAPTPKQIGEMKNLGTPPPFGGAWAGGPLGTLKPPNLPGPEIGLGEELSGDT